MAHTKDVNAFHPETSRNGQVNDNIALNDGPSTPIKLYKDVNQPDGRFLINTGVGRIGNVRLKKKK